MEELFTAVDVVSNSKMNLPNYSPLFAAVGVFTNSKMEELFTAVGVVTNSKMNLPNYSPLLVLSPTAK